MRRGQGDPSRDRPPHHGAGQAARKPRRFPMSVWTQHHARGDRGQYAAEGDPTARTVDCTLRTRAGTLRTSDRALRTVGGTLRTVDRKPRTLGCTSRTVDCTPRTVGCRGWATARSGIAMRRSISGRTSLCRRSLASTQAGGHWGLEGRRAELAQWSFIRGRPGVDPQSRRAERKSIRASGSRVKRKT